MKFMKDFDSINRDILMKQLQKELGEGNSIAHLIKNLLTHYTIQIDVGTDI
jgi:hypothetical protein